MLDTIEPIESIEDLQKGILVPQADFEAWLQRHDWTWHQLARSEFPEGYASSADFQLACIMSDPVLWVQCFLREPEDPDHQEPYNLWDYQKEALRHRGNKIYYCGAEVGKTRDIVADTLYMAFTNVLGSGLIGAPQQTHLDEIIEALNDQLEWNPELGKARRHPYVQGGWKKHPHHAFYFYGEKHRFKIDFRPSGYDGEAYRGVHARTFVKKDEAAKDKNKKQWSEFWRAMKPGCLAGIYSVPDGDRSCDFFKLKERSLGTKKKEEVEKDLFADAGSHVRDLKFTLIQWPKTIMPAPYWSEERRRFFIDQYGGEDAPEYRHNVLGEDGDPEDTVFPWHQLKMCIKDIPEYRCLKILVDSTNNEVSVNGYKCEYVAGDHGPIPRQVSLIDTRYAKREFFESSPLLPPAGDNHDCQDTERRVPTENTSEFRKLIKNFFVSVHGLKRGGADFGYSGDPTEIVVKSIYGNREKVVARLQLKHVTYDQQCQALDAVDDVYGPKENIIWGTDFGNAGSAVAHDLQGLPQYQHKDYEDRLKGFQFESNTDNVDEHGDPVIDARKDEPAKITLKELSTDILTKKVQNQESEYPPDADFILYYTNHTVRYGGKHRIYKKEDDHLIDADRCQKLAQILAETVEDIFACG